MRRLLRWLCVSLAGVFGVLLLVLVVAWPASWFCSVRYDVRYVRSIVEDSSAVVDGVEQVNIGWTSESGFTRCFLAFGVVHLIHHARPQGAYDPAVYGVSEWSRAASVSTNQVPPGKRTVEHLLRSLHQFRWDRSGYSQGPTEVAAPLWVLILLLSGVCVSLFAIARALRQPSGQPDAIQGVDS